MVWELLTDATTPFVEAEVHPLAALVMGHWGCSPHGCLSLPTAQAERKISRPELFQCTVRLVQVTKAKSELPYMGHGICEPIQLHYA